MTIVKAANLALAFLLELCALTAFGYWGFHSARGSIARIGLGIGAPLLMAVVGGTFLAPRASVKVPDALHLVLVLVVFGLVALALAAAGRRWRGCSGRSS